MNWEFFYTWLNRWLTGMRGGGESIQSIRDDQNALLDLARNPYSTTYTLVIGTETTIFLQSDTSPWAFLGGYVDCSNMVAGDTLRIRVYVTVKSGGSYRQVTSDSVNTYSGVQEIPLKHINGPGDIYNQYGIKITLTQTLGTGRAFDCSFFDAVRST